MFFFDVSKFKNCYVTQIICFKSLLYVCNRKIQTSIELSGNKIYIAIVSNRIFTFISYIYI